MFNEWKEIKIKVDRMALRIMRISSQEGICHSVYYKKIHIGYVFYNGVIVFIDNKKGWIFKAEYNEDGYKTIYKFLKEA